MCGRYTQTQSIEKIIKRFGLPSSQSRLKPQYNIAPSQKAPILISNESGKRSLDMFTWGLIPSWAKDPSIGSRMINARAETLAKKASFKQPLKRTRCLIPADGFYEWKKDPTGRTKTPMRIVLKSGELFVFAGLWDTWKDPEGKEIRSYTIITTNAIDVLKPIHDRMPVILKPEDEDAWLNPGMDVMKLMDLLKPYLGKMEAYPVSKLVNSPRNDTVECIQQLN